MEKVGGYPRAGGGFIFLDRKRWFVRSLFAALGPTAKKPEKIVQELRLKQVQKPVVPKGQVRRADSLFWAKQAAMDAEDDEYERTEWLRFGRWGR